MTINGTYVKLLIATVLVAGIALIAISLTQSNEEPINTQPVDLPSDDVLGVTDEIVFSDCGEGVQCLYNAFAANCSEANVQLERKNARDGFTLRSAEITNTEGCVIEVALSNDDGESRGLNCAGMGTPTVAGLPLLLCEADDGEEIELFTL